MSKDNEFPGWHGTTIVSVRKGNKVVIAGDGQVSAGATASGSCFCGEIHRWCMLSAYCGG